MPTGDSRHPPRPSRLWLWFVVAFAVQLVVWGGWLAIASRHRVPEVPLVRVR
ncbi:MAG: hypothetical protein RIR76_3422 [Verrucomicrobiota bacterium]